MTAALLAALCLQTLNPATHAGWLLGQTELPPPPPPPAVAPAAPRLDARDRELTIRALRDELAELADQKSSIGYVFPILCIGAGVGLIVAGLLVRTDQSWLTSTLLIGGTAIAVLSTLWFIYRIVRGISLGSQISEKEEQLRKLESQRLQPAFGLLPGGGAYGALTVRI